MVRIENEVSDDAFTYMKHDKLILTQPISTAAEDTALTTHQLYQI